MSSSVCSTNGPPRNISIIYICNIAGWFFVIHNAELGDVRMRTVFKRPGTWERESSSWFQFCFFLWESSSTCIFWTSLMRNKKRGWSRVWEYSFLFCVCFGYCTAIVTFFWKWIVYKYFLFIQWELWEVCRCGEESV